MYGRFLLSVYGIYNVIFNKKMGSISPYLGYKWYMCRDHSLQKLSCDKIQLSLFEPHKVMHNTCTSYIAVFAVLSSESDLKPGVHSTVPIPSLTMI